MRAYKVSPFGVTFSSVKELAVKLGYTSIGKAYIEKYFGGSLENLIKKRLGTDDTGKIIPILKQFQSEISAEKIANSEKKLNTLQAQQYGMTVDPVVLGTLSFAFKSADIQAQAQAINQAATAFLVTPDEVKRRLELALNMQFKTENETGAENKTEN